jgi:hypothetical protein
MLDHVVGSVSPVQPPADAAVEIDSVRRRKMLASAEESLAAAAAAVHADPDAALDDILAARALIAAVLTVWCSAD